MGQRADQIENELQRERNALGKNLEELELRVKSVGDWRKQFEHHPNLFLGVAFAGGIAIAGMKRSNGTREIHRLEEAHPVQMPRPAAPKERQTFETWEVLKGALIAVGTDSLLGYVEKLIPGFSQRYREAEARKSPSRFGPQRSAA